MSKARFWILLNTIILLFTFLIGSATSTQSHTVPTVSQLNTPSSLSFVYAHYTKTGEGNTFTLKAISLNANQLPETTLSPHSLTNQTDTAFCETDSLHPSPTHTALIAQINCEDGLFLRLYRLNQQNPSPITFSRTEFLDWSPNGNSFLARNIDQGIVTLYATWTDQSQTVHLSPETYNATFTPDGRHLLYAGSRGLGFGSQLGIYDLTTQQTTLWHTFPQQIVAFPRLSPDSQKLAYLLMPDNNTPFTTGELWLADPHGHALTLLDNQADVGHGYPPLWDSDGSTLTYVRRENPSSVAANHNPYELHSNLYQIAINTNQITQLTHFSETLVYDPIWSPDGQQLAFTANDAVWILQPGQSPTQISPQGQIARHPLWLHLSR